MCYITYLFLYASLTTQKYECLNEYDISITFVLTGCIIKSGLRIARVSWRRPRPILEELCEFPAGNERLLSSFEHWVFNITNVYFIHRTIYNDAGWIRHAFLSFPTQKILPVPTQASFGVTLKKKRYLTIVLFCLRHVTPPHRLWGREACYRKLIAVLQQLLLSKMQEIGGKKQEVFFFFVSQAWHFHYRFQFPGTLLSCCATKSFDQLALQNASDFSIYAHFKAQDMQGKFVQCVASFPFSCCYGFSLGRNCRVYKKPTLLRCVRWCFNTEWPSSRIVSSK